MSVFGDIVKDARYIDNELYVSFDETNYNKLEVKLKVQQDEIESLKEHNIQLMKRQELNCKIIKKYQNIIKEVREFIEDDRLYQSNGNVLSIANTGCGKRLLEILDKENK